MRAWRAFLPHPPTAPIVVATADFGCEGYSLLITTSPLSSRTGPSQAILAGPAHAWWGWARGVVWWALG